MPIIGVRDDYVIINEAYSIRDADDPFGRLMTDLRKSFTQDDREPFETMSGRSGSSSSSSSSSSGNASSTTGT